VRDSAKWESETLKMTMGIISRIANRIRLARVSDIAEREARWILTHSLENRRPLRQLIRDRINGRPLQFVLGTQPFLDLEIECCEGQLIPRPETEQWCSWLIQKLQHETGRSGTILEIGSGTGCVSLSLAKQLPNYRIIGVDIDLNSVGLSKKNKKLHGISNVDFHHISGCQEGAESVLKSLNNGSSFDVLVSNPPYISEHEWSQLDASVRRFESPRALCSGHIGLDLIYQILDRSENLLSPRKFDDKRPSVLIEFGQEYQTVPIIRRMNDSGFADVEICKDFAGRSRWAVGRLISENTTNYYKISPLN
jgi:release factor glutamine methyltransferase